MLQVVRRLFSAECALHLGRGFQKTLKHRFSISPTDKAKSMTSMEKISQLQLGLHYQAVQCERAGLRSETAGAEDRTPTVYAFRPLSFRSALIWSCRMNARQQLVCIRQAIGAHLHVYLHWKGIQHCETTLQWRPSMASRDTQNSLKNTLLIQTKNADRMCFY